MANYATAQTKYQHDIHVCLQGISQLSPTSQCILVNIVKDYANISLEHANLTKVIHYQLV